MQKEQYFTPENIEEVSSQFLEELTAYRQRHTDIVFRPDKAALLVLDMQRYFFEPESHAFIPSAPAIVPGVARLLSVFEENQCPVIFTRHTNTDKDAGMMAVWWRDLIKTDDARSQNIISKPNSIIIPKSQYDAFHETELDILLQSTGTRQVIITGVMTHLCCETTARSAFMHGYEVFFTIDGTATYTEAFHRASLLNLAHGFAVPVLMGEILSAYE